MTAVITSTGQANHCLRCGRKLTASTGAYGPVCARKIRQAAIDELAADFTPEQRDKAGDLIRDGALVPVRSTARNGVLYQAVSSRGDGFYLVTATGCGCPAGVRGRRCYHRLSAQMLTIATRRQFGKAA